MGNRNVDRILRQEILKAASRGGDGYNARETNPPELHARFLPGRI